MSDCAEIENPELTSLIDEARIAMEQARSVCAAATTMLATQKQPEQKDSCAAGLVACCCAVKQRLIDVLKRLNECYSHLCSHWQYPKAADAMLSGLAHVYEAFALIMEKINNTSAAQAFREKAADFRRISSEFSILFLENLFSGLLMKIGSSDEDPDTAGPEAVAI
jgi:hypothetical protein